MRTHPPSRPHPIPILTLQTELELNIPPETIIQRLKKLSAGKVTYSPTGHTFRFLALIRGVFGARIGIDLFYITGIISPCLENHSVNVRYVIYPGLTFWLYCVLDILFNLACFFLNQQSLSLWPNLLIGSLIIMVGRRHQSRCSKKIKTLLQDGRILFEL